MKKMATLLMAAALLVVSAQASRAEKMKEFPIGDEMELSHMKIAAVYLKAVDMEPRGMGLPASKSDIHLEADIHATQGNPTGFGVGEWIPSLTVDYRLENVSTGKVQTGTFMGMVAKDGPHYGTNIKMMGPGNYRLSYTIAPPSKQGFARHTDKASGVGKWFEPFTVDFDFNYVPLS